MDMRTQKVKLALTNLAILVFGAGLLTGIYMYADKQIKQEQSCDEPCPDCVPRVPLTNLEEQ